MKSNGDGRLRAYKIAHELLDRVSSDYEYINETFIPILVREKVHPSEEEVELLISHNLLSKSTL